MRHMVQAGTHVAHTGTHRHARGAHRHTQAHMWHARGTHTGTQVARTWHAHKNACGTHRHTQAHTWCTCGPHTCIPPSSSDTPPPLTHTHTQTNTHTHRATLTCTTDMYSGSFCAASSRLPSQPAPPITPPYSLACSSGRRCGRCSRSASTRGGLAAPGSGSIGSSWIPDGPGSKGSLT